MPFNGLQTLEASKGIASMHTLTLDANFLGLQRRIHATILPRMARLRTTAQVLQMIHQ
jgi:hypothetical protein